MKKSPVLWGAGCRCLDEGRTGAGTYPQAGEKII